MMCDGFEEQTMESKYLVIFLDVLGYKSKVNSDPLTVFGN